MSEKLQVPKVSTQADKVNVKITESPTEGTITYTFPASEVRNTNTPRLVTYINPDTGKEVTVNQDSPILDQITQAYGPGGTPQAAFVIMENSLKGTTTKNPKGMAAILTARVVVSTLKYKYGTSQYGWGTALAAGTLSNLGKLSILSYFKNVKFKNKKLNENFEKLAKKSDAFHHLVEGATGKPIKDKIFKIGGKEFKFNYLGAQFGGNRIEAKYINAKAAVWALKGKGHSNGGHGNSESETHPQNKIEHEGHRNNVDKNTHTNTLKIVTTAQTEIPDEILQFGIQYDLGIKKKKPLTPNQKKLLEIRYKRRWVIADAIERGDTGVQIAPNVILDLTQYKPSREVTAALQTIEFNKTGKSQQLTGTAPAVGPGGAIQKGVAIAMSAYETVAQFSGLAQFWWKANFADTDAEKKNMAQTQAIAQLKFMGGKVVTNKDGSTTVVIPKDAKAKLDKANTLFGNKSVQQKLVLEKQEKQAKEASDRNLLFNYAEQQRKKGPNTYSQINNGLGINTQRGPQTGTFGQSLGWSK